jgi:hypothetical protein
MTVQIEMPGAEMGRRLDYAEWEKGVSVPWIDKMWKLLDDQDRLDSRFYTKYQVNWEPRVSETGWSLERHEIPKRCYERLFHCLSGPRIELSRDCGYGPITVLKHDGQVWMSDTRAEILEHAEFLNKLWYTESLTPRVLINGLGLGMAVKAALTHHASHIDVVEIDEKVIELIAPQFEEESASGRVTIHHADAYEMEWPKGTEWSLAWHDIWPTIASSNIEEMDRLHKKYKSKVKWQASWQRKGCIRMRRVEKEVEEAMHAGDWATVRRLDPEF